MIISIDFLHCQKKNVFTHSVEDCNLSLFPEMITCITNVMNLSGNDKFNRKKSKYQGIIIFGFFWDLIHNYFENYENSNMIITPPPKKKREEF